MEEVKFNNLCFHYKDTFDIHRESIKQRDRLFSGLLVILALFTLQFYSADAIVSVVNDYVNKESGIKLGANANFISTLLWLILLGCSTRYFQVVLDIERQYKYLHMLEQELNSFYSQSKIFTREGKFYLNKRPLFSKWVQIVYTIFFPSIIILCITMRISNQIEHSGFSRINQLVDFICYIVILTSSFLYSYHLHESHIRNFFDRFIRFIRNHHFYKI